MYVLDSNLVKAFIGCVYHILRCGINQCSLHGAFTHASQRHDSLANLRSP